MIDGARPRALRGGHARDRPRRPLGPPFRPVPQALDRDVRGQSPRRCPFRPRPARLRPRWPSVEVVLPILHGPFGEDGRVQGLLEMAGVPYVGADHAASAVCMDKDLFKAVMRDQGIPVTRNVTLRERRPRREPVRLPGVRQAGAARLVGRDLEGARRRGAPRRGRARLPPRREGPGRGVRLRDRGRGRRARQPRAVRVAGRRDRRHAQRVVRLRGQVRRGRDGPGRPARITPEQTARVQELAVQAFVATECEGMARVDCFVRGRRRGARQRAEHDPGLHLDERLREAVRGVGIPYPSCSTGWSSSRSSGTSAAARLAY